MEADEEVFLSIESIRSKSAIRFAQVASPMDASALFFSPSPTPPLEAAIPASPDPSAVDEEMQEAVEQVQRIVGYSFRNVSLLAEALTHPSYLGRTSYQRLEFLGDAALNLAFTNFVYLTNASIGPGPLSVLRAANISTEKLARVAVRHDFYSYLRRNSCKLDDMVKEFSNVVSKEKDEYGGLPYGGRTLKAPKVLADIVESIAAAIYVDCKFDLVKFWKVFRGILEPIITMETLDEQPVTCLYELCQKRGMSVEFKNWKNINGNITNVFVDGVLVGVGSSEQKHIAKLNAARDALQKLYSNECDTMEVEKCSSLDSGMTEEPEASRYINIGVSSKKQLNGGEEIDGSKRKLHDLCHKKHWAMPIYGIKEKQGPAHDMRFLCSVKVAAGSETLMADGDPKSRVKEAENSAAYKLLCQLNYVTSS